MPEGVQQNDISSSAQLWCKKENKYMSGENCVQKMKTKNEQMKDIL